MEWNTLLLLRSELWVKQRETIASHRKNCSTLRNLLGSFVIICFDPSFASERTNHAPLRLVLKTKELEAQLARWMELLSSFEYEIKYREGQRQHNADAMSRRPCGEGCNWCKKWKKAEQLISVAVHTNASFARPVEFVEERTQGPQAEQNKAEGTTKHCLSNDPLSPWFNTIKLEPTWTRGFLTEQKVADASTSVKRNNGSQTKMGRRRLP